MPIDETEDSFRIRQVNPSAFDSRSFRTITISEKEGIKAVVGCKRGSYASGRCQVGMKIQTYIFSKEKWTLERAKAWVESHKKKEEWKPWYKQPGQKDVKESKATWMDEVNKVFEAMNRG